MRRFEFSIDYKKVLTNIHTPLFMILKYNQIPFILVNYEVTALKIINKRHTNETHIITSTEFSINDKGKNFSNH